MARGLKIRLYCLYSENKEADQLRGNRSSAVPLFSNTQETPFTIELS